MRVVTVKTYMEENHLIFEKLAEILGYKWGQDVHNRAKRNWQILEIGGGIHFIKPAAVEVIVLLMEKGVIKEGVIDKEVMTLLIEKGVIK